MHRLARAAALAALLAAPLSAAADEIATAIADAARAWSAAKPAEAKAALEEALQLLAQRSAVGLGEALPAALPGWTVVANETGAVAMAMFGGTTAKRTYRDTKRQQVTIDVTADSPLVAQLGMLLGNPAMAGSMGRMTRIGSQRAVITNDNEVQMLVDNRILVNLSGSAPVEAKLAYAQAIDLARLAQRR